MRQVLVGWLGLLDVLQTSLIQTIEGQKWKLENGRKSEPEFRRSKEGRIPKSEFSGTPKLLAAGFKACLKNGSRRGNEADFLVSARNRPPRYLGGYS